MKILTFILGVLAAAGTLSAQDALKSDYPLTTCVVSGEKLGTMGAPYSFTYKDTEVRLCCEYCKPKFQKDPDKYLKALKQEGSKP